MKGKTKKIIDALITYCLLIIVAFIFLFPCLWLILASFSSTGNLYSIPGFFPESYSFKSFITLSPTRRCMPIRGGCSIP